MDIHIDIAEKQWKERSLFPLGKIESRGASSWDINIFGNRQRACPYGDTLRFDLHWQQNWGQGDSGSLEESAGSCLCAYTNHTCELQRGTESKTKYYISDEVSFRSILFWNCQRALGRGERFTLASWCLFHRGRLQRPQEELRTKHLAT